MANLGNAARFLLASRLKFGWAKTRTPRHSRAIPEFNSNQNSFWQILGRVHQNRFGVSSLASMKNGAIKSIFTTVATVGDRVYKRGKIFAAGDYPDKGVTVTVENLRDGARLFAPCPINIEHGNSVFDGKLGELVSVEIMDDGSVFGTTAIPAPLAALLGDEPIPVSVELRHSDWVIEALAFAKNPRVTDAALFAAFGAPQPGKNGNQKMNLKDKIKALFNAAVDEIPADELEVTQTPPPTSTPPAQNPAPAPNDADARLKAEQDARIAAEAELAKLKNEAETARKTAETEKVLAASMAFSDQMVLDRRITPAQRDNLAVQYAAALKMDAQSNSVFSADGAIVEGNAAKALREMIGANSQHKFTEEFASNFSVVNGGKTNSDKISDERKAELMGGSTLGRAAAKGGK